MKQKQKEVRYSYPLKLDNKLKEPLSNIAKTNRRKLNEEINFALELYISQNKDKIK